METYPFEKIENPHLSSIVIGKIITAIHKGDFKVGERLPPERKLGEMLGISRPTVRQALYALTVLGVLEVRQGSGTYIKTASIGEELAAKAAQLLSSGLSPIQALDARLIFEPEIAASAAIHREKIDLTKLKHVLIEMQKKVIRHERLGYSDMDFHLIIARSLDNEYVEHTISLLLSTWFGSHGVWMELQDSILSIPGRSEAYLQQHQAIYDAIYNADPETARKMMQEHLKRVYEDFLSIS